MHKLLLALSACFALSAQAIELKGHLTQGGMVTGQLEGIKSVSFNGKELDVTSDGQFVFGFGRDAKSDHSLTWVDKNNQKHTKSFLITSRDYDIDRITGVAKKYVSPPKEVLQRIRNDSAKVGAARSKGSKLEFFDMPVYRPAKGRISGVYGSQRYFNGEPRRPHFGLDIANKTGTPIWAPLSGKVVLAESDLYYSGGTLILDHGYGITSTYIHMSKLHVKVGDMVSTGDVIGDIGATGRVTGPHLDWRFNWFGERLDPELLMIDKLANKSSK
ncbi:peptidoglycan DD-metalloendopeptidase family protein [Pseudoalteromonas luteoviolacea]|uniref:M23 family metallopeptidase n=1 Tax=Pseudoalteromonas luteoviolacea TaxID=43657 RepID=UPI001B3A02A8|nr:peptidoglycan DD-metalloendopeptidase family protein [Pseudoalteromonas luteoviolacea]MBQ4879828.1 peptidoglycan DD-metalloendopeptidase family protein [Pseudoalteromonas luteoviolacea]MBQ4908868.1 peptidoglycan DD-metalloendopeptidase family protein [Pseudoalteromonas luteoviolacea]